MLKIFKRMENLKFQLKILKRILKKLKMKMKNSPKSTEKIKDFIIILTMYIKYKKYI